MPTYSIKVSSHIHFVAILLCLLMATVSTISIAQTSSENTHKAKPQAPIEQVELASEASSQLTSKPKGQDAILRLEDTIRGNKEQPQVLTIVPWQLPVHQRINENKEWQLQVKHLPLIERNAFLRNLAVVNEIKASQVDNKRASPVK